MSTCDIAFKYRDRDNSVYIAPDRLPETWRDGEREDRWGDAPADNETVLKYESLPPAIMRNAICTIGVKAGLNGDYWKNGLYVFERETRSRLLIEQRLNDDWSGTITVQTRGGQSERLAKFALEIISQEENRMGVHSTPTENETGRGGLPTGQSDDDLTLKNAGFEPPPRDTKSYFVSYAWGNSADPADAGHEKIVDEFCSKASVAGFDVQRDKDVMKTGDRISVFMARLARGDRIVVVLSKKYLQSPFCMTELYEIWLQARAEESGLLDRISVYVHDDAKIWTPADRAGCAVYWRKEFKKLDDLVQEHDFNILSDRDKIAYGMMMKFANSIGDILSTIVDSLLPQSIDALFNHTFHRDDDNLN